MYVGRQQVSGIADWVIWDKETGKAATIIEAKEPGQSLDEAVKGQARSYAFALKAPMYVLTNGWELKIYQRGVQNDSCIFDCDVNELSRRWEELNCILGHAEQEKTMSEVIIESMRQTIQDAPEKIGEEEEGKAQKSEGTEGRGKSRTGKFSMDDRTLELVRDNPHKFSEEEIFQIICEEYANDKHPPDRLRDTTRRRLHGHLNKKKGVRIEKDVSGKYFIVE